MAIIRSEDIVLAFSAAGLLDSIPAAQTEGASVPRFIQVLKYFVVFDNSLGSLLS